MRIGRNFNFSLYSVWTIQVFSDCACVTSIKIHKKYFDKNFHATDSDHFMGHEYLPESGESRRLFFFLILFRRLAQSRSPETQSWLRVGVRQRVQWLYLNWAQRQYLWFPSWK